MMGRRSIPFVSRNEHFNKYSGDPLYWQTAKITPHQETSTKMATNHSRVQGVKLGTCRRGRKTHENVDG